MAVSSIRIFFLISIGIILATSASLTAQEKSNDWPQFRGPGGLGVSANAKLPMRWSQTESLVWKTPLPGAGSSSPVILGDKVFVTCYSGYNVPGKPRGDMSQLKLHLVCVSRTTGKILCNTEVAPTLPEQVSVRDGHGYASSTPCVDSERVYAFFNKSGMAAFDHAGKQLWRTNLGDRINGFGSGASPILFGDFVIVNASIESDCIVALDKKTGMEKWRAKGFREAFNTPTLVPLKSGKTELAVGMPGKVVGLDPTTGDQLWTCTNNITWYIVPSVVVHDDLLLSFGGRSGTTAVGLRAGGRGDVTKTHRLWTSTKGGNVSTPIVHQGRVYWLNDAETACCAEAASGNMIFSERVDRIEQVWASPVLADGKLYFLYRRGSTAVLAAGSKFERLATNDLRDGSIFNATPAIAGDQLFIRSDLFLYCIGAK